MSDFGFLCAVYLGFFVWMKLFVDAEWKIVGLKTLIRENDSSASVDHVCITGRLHIAHTTERVKDLAVIVLKVSLTH